MCFLIYRVKDYFTGSLYSPSPPLSSDGPNKIGAVLQRCRSTTSQNIGQKGFVFSLSLDRTPASLGQCLMERIVHCLALNSLVCTVSGAANSLHCLDLTIAFLGKKMHTQHSSQQPYSYGMHPLPRSEEPTFVRITFSQSNG